MAISHNVSLSGSFVGASLTITPTTSTATNCVLAFGMARRGGTITSVQWGGVNLTADGSTAAAAVTVDTYYLALGNITGGSGTSLVVTGNANTWLFGAVCILNDVDQATSLDAATVGATNLSASITTVTAGAALLDVFGDHGNGAGVAMGAQTNRTSIAITNIDPAGSDDNAASSRLVTKAAAGAQTMDWTFAGSLGPALRIMAFRPASAGGGTNADGQRVGGGRVRSRRTQSERVRSYHEHPMMSLDAYYQEQARKHRDFIDKVRRAA
jgi:hypothetical protein